MSSRKSAPEHPAGGSHTAQPKTSHSESSTSQQHWPNAKPTQNTTGRPSDITPGMWLPHIPLQTRFLVPRHANLHATSEGKRQRPIEPLGLHHLRPRGATGLGQNMIYVICAACKKPLALIEDDEEYLEKAQVAAIAHSTVCESSEEDYRQAVYDIKFQKLTKDIDL